MRLLSRPSLDIIPAFRGRTSDVTRDYSGLSHRGQQKALPPD